ncbi:hypothetical protein HJD18_07140 [Thermoleophilia bacterium SCSIO 60948]|nr:hypothetical protein HJD18_07140 [Thermoleophilia bacterium SCSIO 60948]
MTSSETAPALASDAARERLEARRSRVVGLAATAVLSAFFAWWALASGAYFATVSLPGLIILAAVLAVLVIAELLPAGVRRRIDGPGSLAAAALFGLAAWSALSAVWSPSPDTALADGLKIAAYGLAFAFGAIVASGSGGRRELALVPLALTGLIVAAVTIARMLLGDDPAVMLNNSDNTLQAPLGYRNATAALYIVCFIAAAGLAAGRRGGFALRLPAAVVATLCAALAILCQSRASAPAFVLMLVFLIIIAPLKLRLVGWFVILIVPAFLVVPSMEALFEASGSAPVTEAGPEMAAAARAALLAGVVSLALSAAAIAVGPRLPGIGAETPRGNRAVLATVAATIVLGAVGFLVSIGDPGRWVDERLDELRSLETTSFENRSTRFGFEVGTGRLDFWRVAIDEMESSPFAGAGGGGFQYAYTLDRRRLTDARDAHSFELEIGSELGLVGLALIALALIAAAWSVWRTRVEGWDAAHVSAIALAIGFYWVVHASVDWFWSYPGLTAPVLATLGAAAGTRVRAGGLGLPSKATRAAVLVALAAVALAALPPFLSERQVDRAAALREEDPAAALAALDRANELNPLDEVPLLLGGELARRGGEPELARERFEDAVELRPDEWAGFFYLAVLDARTDRDRAEAELERARALNPLEPCLENLAAAVRCSSGKSA